MGKGISAEIIGVRRVGKAAINVLDQRAMGRTGEDDRRERIAFGILIVEQHIEGDRLVFGGGDAVVHGNGGGVGAEFRNQTYIVHRHTAAGGAKTNEVEDQVDAGAGDAGEVGEGEVGLK